jgi:hypothetical protein
VPNHSIKIYCKLNQLAMSHFIEPVITRDDATFADLGGNSYGPWEILEASDPPSQL